jgi:Cytochrome c554 and c-prime
MAYRPPIILWPVLILLSCAIALGTSADDSSASHGMSTAERLKKPGWWPTKGTPARDDYAGPAKCAACHSAVAETQKASAMAQTSSTAPNSEVLQSSIRKEFTVGSFIYQIARFGSGISYSIRSGTQTTSEPLGWALGRSKVGHTFLFERDGDFYESPFSYFETLRGFAATPGFNLLPVAPSATPALRQGAGRPLTAPQAAGCFGCHNTAAQTKGKLDVAQMIPNITCEACHGPGSTHAAAQKSGLDLGPDLIFNPKRLSPVDSVDFCGSCHRTWWDLMLTEEVGVSTVLAVPYRLEKSRCWGKGDERLTCVACHDPHRDLIRDAAAYDRKCLSCHVTKDAGRPEANHPGAACPVSSNQCVTCHMAKYQLPDMHYDFTDHMIRIVKAGAPFPN